ncbi:hypothetical protein J437_LFUL015869 [Ladona fulva]|uniref:Dynamin N-terminal domain-containing protein n=1 Tax=Ladona fulva TaxID=123851 RepID=A0A8K0P802_LADFU|nr:hypothetical protein J437_LFUL015869 [Ladona fulva]
MVPPRRKIVVLLIGNHSAGKSSFINWYIEEHVQKTGVAIETKGFTIVTSGKKRDSLLGNATLHIFPHFKPLSQFKGVMDFLTTEVCSSKQKKFSLVSFVDTPGLVDGDLNYPFDVQGAIQWLGSTADLIFVFFDPVGQALCKRTLNTVEALSDKHAEKMRFFLSKADEAGNDADRQKVMMQIDRNPVKFENQIHEATKDIEQTINHTIQITLDTLEKDSENIVELLDKHLKADQEAREYNRRVNRKVYFLGALAFLIPALFISPYIFPVKSAEDVGFGFLKGLNLNLLFSKADNNGKEERSFLSACLVIFVISIILVLFARLSYDHRATLTNHQRKYYVDLRNYVQGVIKKKNQLYREYLEQSIDNCDI